MYTFLGFLQGPRSNFEIVGLGGVPLVTRYWGGTRHFFFLIVYNFKNIAPLPPYSAVPVLIPVCTAVF